MSTVGPQRHPRDAVTHTVLTPWHAVVGFGVVSLAADMVYEGARAVTGPLLGQLGAGALLVGVVTGAGEAAALVLRLVFGAAADRTGRYWGLTLAGYAMTAVTVPLLAVTPFLGVLGLGVACTLVLVERAGKAVRSPAKSTLLSYAAEGVGLGRGFGVHKALDQVGAFAGPLVVAGVAALTGALWPGFAVLAAPGVASLVLLFWLRRRLGGPEVPARTSAPLPLRHPDLPRAFWMFAASSGAATAGLVTFGVIAFHLSREHLVADAAIPVVYAGAMAVEALAALAVGFLFDRMGARVLYVLPPLVAAVPALAFGVSLPLVLLGIGLWGAATGLQDSTVKALVADLVPSGRRATAYGWFAAVQGGAALAGGTLAGALYERSLPVLVALVAATQVVALVLYAVTLHPGARRRGN
ncbi:MAG: MFS transporter [Lapillicoccus sp.]